MSKKQKKIKQNNANDLSAKYYDTVNKPFKGEDVVSCELDLITSITTKGAKILDIGCGTGRHLIPLWYLGYYLTGIDSSAGMIEQLNLKLKNYKLELQLKTKNFLNLKIINSNIFNFSFREKFDLIILMWNAFNEIVLTEKEAQHFFRILKNLLEKNGKVLINIDDTKIIDPGNLKFSTTVEENGNIYKQNWKVVSFYKKKHTTVSEEKITVLDLKNSRSNTIVSHIKQRWWSKEEIRKLADKFHFDFKIKKIQCNKELYIILKNRV